MNYWETSMYDIMLQSIQKSSLGSFRNFLGHTGEECVVKILRKMHIDARLATKGNQEGYDALIYDNNNTPVGVIQIKTDINGDGKCPHMEQKQIHYLCHLVNEKGRHVVPLLIEYYPYFNDLMLVYNFDFPAWKYSVDYEHVHYISNNYTCAELINMCKDYGIVCKRNKNKRYYIDLLMNN